MNKNVIVELFKSNIVAIVVGLITIGGLIFAIKNHGLLLDAQEAKIISLFKVNTELKVADAQVAAKLDMMISDVKDIKGDVKILLQRNGKSAEVQDGSPLNIAKVASTCK